MTVGRGVDACLSLNDDGLYDFRLDDSGDIATADFFDTAILVSLFGDRRANASQITEAHRRRGWIGNESTPGFQMGSTIWLFEQARIRRSTLNDIRTAAQESLQWLVDNSYAKEVVARSRFGDIDQIILEITIVRFNDKVEKRFFNLWDQTALIDGCGDPILKAHNTIILFNQGVKSNLDMWELMGSPTHEAVFVLQWHGAAGSATINNPAFTTGTGWHPNARLILYLGLGATVIGKGGDGGDGFEVAAGGNRGGGGGGGAGGSNPGVQGINRDGETPIVPGFTTGGAGGSGNATGGVDSHSFDAGKDGGLALLLEHDLTLRMGDVSGSEAIIAGGGGGGGGGFTGDIDGQTGGDIGLPGEEVSGQPLAGVAGAAISKQGHTLTLEQTGIILGDII